MLTTLLLLTVLRGDANCDGRVDLSDVTAILGFLYLAGPAPCCLEAANANGSARSIAGVLNETKTVLGLMPHPEDATDPLLGSTDGRGFFDGLVGALS